jgi:hypothetical protein
MEKLCQNDVAEVVKVPILQENVDQFFHFLENPYAPVITDEDPKPAKKSKQSILEALESAAMAITAKDVLRFK